MRLRPFFSYYGSKWAIAHLYPRPQHKAIIEPFAGSAQYSLLYWHKDVFLYDLDDNICMVWDYLISATEKEIASLDVDFEHIDDLKGYTQEQKTLLGFWCAKGAAYPQKRKSSFLRQYSGTADYRRRCIDQMQYIRHWKIKQCSYEDIKNMDATWFIDPPYKDKGSYYRCSSSGIDFDALALWCKSRRGSVIVCENAGADWLPFVDLVRSRSLRRGIKNNECIYTDMPEEQASLFGDL